MVCEFHRLPRLDVDRRYGHVHFEAPVAVSVLFVVIIILAISGKVIGLRIYLGKMLRQENYHWHARSPGNAVEQLIRPGSTSASDHRTSA